MKRNIIKTIFLHVFVITIIGGLFCHGYINGFSLSKYDRIYCYAEADNWSSCDTSDLVTAFRYYCKSRNLAIEGSIADALTSFTTTTFNNICSTLGIDPTQLQAELKKTTAGNLGLRFLFSQTGITAYNRIFAEFLQNNDLSVGDTVDDEIINSQETFKDADNNTCLIWNMPVVNNNDTNVKPITYGNTYKYNGYDIYNNGNQANYTVVCNYNNGNSVSTISHLYYYFATLSSNSKPYKDVYKDSSSRTSFVANTRIYYVNDTNGDVVSGKTIIFRVNNGNTLYFGGYIKIPELSIEAWKSFGTLSFNSEDIGITNIYLTTNNNTINNNTYNNNYTIIYNDGDTYISDDDDEPLPSTPPGGGGGDDPGSDPDNWNPTTPTIPGPTNPSFPTIDLPDIDIPDLPSLDFSLGNLRNKFPFSLPFDIIAVLNVLDGEPQAPVIDATIPIGSFYTWEFHADFSEFDNYARIFRAFEFIGFVIGLAVFTVHFAKG